MKLIYLSTFVFGVFILGCAGNTDQHTENKQAPKRSDSQTIESSENVPISEVSLDVSKLPFSEVDLGEFPYISPPEHYCFDFCNDWEGKHREQDIKDLDREYFAVDGKLVRIDGKSYKQTIEKNRDTDPSGFNRLVVIKGLDKTILGLGGVRINNVAVPYSEIERVGKQEVLDHGNSIDFNRLDDIHTYLIRKKDRQVWIQFFAMDEESGRITIIDRSE